MMSPFIKKLFPLDMYEKLFTEYNMNIQLNIKENNLLYILIYFLINYN